MINPIEVKNIYKNYSDKNAVNGINFSVSDNEIVGLLGHNGCGKTTTIASMLGLLRASSGQVLIKGKDIEKNRSELLHKMNFISPYIELPKKLTVKENLIVYARLYNVNKLNDRIDYLVETLNLKNFINQKTGELSSGQKNRVSLEKSLINTTSILLLEEPNASLDSANGDVVRICLRKYIKENTISPSFEVLSPFFKILIHCCSAFLWSLVVFVSAPSMEYLFMSFVTSEFIPSISRDFHS